MPVRYKTKEVRGSITIELSDVESPGCFLELEILTGDIDSETVELVRKSLFGLPVLIGINENRIETRYYNETLAEL
jgi:adenylate cyclase class IV